MGSGRVDVVLKSALHYIVFDAVVKINITGSSSVTTHPVESGAAISDHIVKDNTRISLTGFVVDLYDKMPGEWSGEGPFEQTPLSAKIALREMQNSNLPLSLVTPTGFYTDLVVTKYSEPRTVEHGGEISSGWSSWEITIDLQQIQKVKSGVGTVPVSEEIEKKTSNTSGSKSGNKSQPGVLYVPFLNKGRDDL